MRQSTIIFLSFILSAQSVMSAYAASSTIMADDTIVIEQNSSPVSLPQQRPVPQPAPQPVTQAQSSTPEKPKPSEKKTASKKQKKQTKPAPQEVSSDLPYYVLGGLAVGGIVALAAGGGGGGGGGDPAPVVPTPTPDPTPNPDPTPTPPSNFETLEYNNQYGLGKIKASSAYARGYTGAGVTVAVIDSGFDTTHPDLAGNMLAGIDVVDGDTNINNPDTLYHGNWVSGVVASVRNGLAVVSIERGASAGSFFTIPPQTQVEIAARKKIITDEHSGRILVDATLAEEEKEKMEKLFSKF
jgi:subtilisin family serine protease